MEKWIIHDKDNDPDDKPIISAYNIEEAGKKYAEEINNEGDLVNYDEDGIEIEIEKEGSGIRQEVRINAMSTIEYSATVMMHKSDIIASQINKKLEVLSELCQEAQKKKKQGLSLSQIYEKDFVEKINRACIGLDEIFEVLDNI